MFSVTVNNSLCRCVTHTPLQICSLTFASNHLLPIPHNYYCHPVHVSKIGIIGEIVCAFRAISWHACHACGRVRDRSLKCVRVHVFVCFGRVLHRHNWKYSNISTHTVIRIQTVFSFPFSFVRISFIGMR